MTRKPRIEPPPIPKGEAASITVANQARQIDTLLARVEELTAQVDAYASDCRRAEEECERLAEEASDRKDEMRRLTESYCRVIGWQDCAREIFAYCELTQKENP